MNERGSIRIRPFNPMRAVGYLFRVRGGQLGSCFAFHKMPYFLTAAHCVRDTPAAELGILLPAHSEHFVKIESVSVHSEADIAVLRADQTFLNVDPFWSATKRVLLGQDFATYAYPDVPGQPQFAKGYFQRFREHRSHMGFEYLAGEVNTAIETLKALDGYLADYRIGDNEENAPLFTDRHGEALTGNAIRKLFERLRVRTGIRDLCARLLRHTWATNFHRSGSGSRFDLIEPLTSSLKGKRPATSGPIRPWQAARTRRGD